MKKYFVFVLLLVIAACSFTSNNELNYPEIKEIKERGQLLVAADVPYGVMEYFDSEGNVVGIDVEIGQEIASHLGVELVVIDYDWEPLFDAVKSGEVDLAISAMTITPERAEEMLFSIPYFNAGQVVVVHKDNVNIEGPLDLMGKKVGVQGESTSEPEAHKYTNESLVILYTGYNFDLTDEGMLYDLRTGITDAIIIDLIAGIDIVNYDENFKIAGEPFTEEFYGIATKNDNEALIEVVDKVLREMKRTGKLKEITDKYT